MRNLDEPFSALVKLLGEENAEDLKKRLCDLIVDQVEYDMKHYSEYLLYPPDMKDLIKDAMIATRGKVEKMYKDAVIEINQDYIEKMKQYMAQQINSPDKNMRKKIIDYANKLYWESNEYGKERKIAKELFEICQATQEEIMSIEKIDTPG